MLISQEFEWQMSHRLKSHQGACKNIHGHTYKLRLVLEGALEDDNGMVLDYYKMAEAVNPVIFLLDHAFLCDESDKLMLDFLKENEFKHTVMKNEPTAENICYWFADKLQAIFSGFKNLFSMKIRVYETHNTYAEIEISL